LYSLITHWYKYVMLRFYLTLQPTASLSVSHHGIGPEDPSIKTSVAAE
jgi:hypothetical protein